MIYCSQLRATPSADCNISHIALGLSNYLIHNAPGSGGSRGRALGTRPPLFWIKKEEMTERKKASSANKSRPPPSPLRLSSRSGSTTAWPELEPGPSELDSQRPSLPTRHNFRNSELNYYVPRPRTESAKGSLHYRGSVL